MNENARKKSLLKAFNFKFPFQCSAGAPRIDTEANIIIIIIIIIFGKCMCICTSIPHDDTKVCMKYEKKNRERGTNKSFAHALTAENNVFINRVGTQLHSPETIDVDGKRGKNADTRRVPMLL